MKKFIITIDTEGDNLWEWKQGDRITTDNVNYLPRFQTLCNQYGFKPVYLTNYEIMQDPQYLEFIAKVEQDHAGELGMHLHAWNTPPAYNLEAVQPGAPYLIEYPKDIMEEKIAVMTEAIKQVGITPVSHRAGRWATDRRYFELLIRYGYKVDCSVTPHIDWAGSVGATAGSKGSDYRKSREEPYWISCENGRIWEVPVTVRKTHSPVFSEKPTLRSFMGGMYRSVRGTNLWLRPDGRNNKAMIKLVDKIRKSDSEYIMFMLHSSELMPGGSPIFRTEESIENLYSCLNNLFDYCARYFEGITLRDFYQEKTGENE